MRGLKTAVWIKCLKKSKCEEEVVPSPNTKFH